MLLGRSKLSAVLALFIHVLDRGLVNHQVGGAAAVHLEAASVIPFDGSPNLFAIAKHNYHRRFRLHLLLIIEILRVGLLRRGWFFSQTIRPVMVTVSFDPVGPLATFSHGNRRMIVLGSAQGRPNQLAIGKSLWLQGVV